MKKILMALAVVGIAYSGANAQTTNGCKLTAAKKHTTTHYKKNYAENFKVCKSNAGYVICGESPSRLNSTDPYMTQLQNNTTYMNANRQTYAANTQTIKTPADMIAPQSQSYPSTDVVYAMSNANSYEGNYPNARIKVCYGGDNVAEDNRMPYQGCPSPQFDGPEKNNNRNINESNPAPMPPISGYGNSRR